MDYVLVREMIFVSYSGCGGGKVIHKKRILTTRRLHCPLTFLFSLSFLLLFSTCWAIFLEILLTGRYPHVAQSFIQFNTKRYKTGKSKKSSDQCSASFALNINSDTISEFFPGLARIRPWTQYPVHMFDSMLYRAQSRREFIDTYNRCPLN